MYRYRQLLTPCFIAIYTRETSYYTYKLLFTVRSFGSENGFLIRLYCIALVQQFTLGRSNK